MKHKWLNSLHLFTNVAQDSPEHESGIISYIYVFECQYVCMCLCFYFFYFTIYFE